MKIKKFADHKYAQARIYSYDNGAVALISYNTTVITIDRDGWMCVKGLYSRTTIKHIGWFMKERGFTYQLAKQLYHDNKLFNVNTGEIRDWE